MGFQYVDTLCTRCSQGNDGTTQVIHYIGELGSAPHIKIPQTDLPKKQQPEFLFSEIFEWLEVGIYMEVFAVKDLRCAVMCSGLQVFRQPMMSFVLFYR